MTVTKELGHPVYLQLLDDMKALHRKKAADYGTGVDPLANLRQGEAIGIPAWKAAYLRAKDKVQRVDAYCLKGTLENEGVEDSFMDLAAYALLALLLHREMKDKDRPKSTADETARAPVDARKALEAL